MNIKAFFSVVLSFVYLLSPAFSLIEAEQPLEIKIIGVPAEEKARIDGVYPVSKKGTVDMPFIGEMRAEGLESHELAKAIQKAYREADIYNNVVFQVIANVGERDVVEQRVHIGGQVRTPGPRPFTKGLTVFQAVQAAGGATEFGAMNRVILWRDGKQQKIDLTKAEGMGFVTLPNDTIQVPQKNIISR